MFKASLKIGDSEWSNKFSLDAVGSSGTVMTHTKDGRTYGVSSCFNNLLLKKFSLFYVISSDNIYLKKC